MLTGAIGKRTTSSKLGVCIALLSFLAFVMLAAVPASAPAVVIQMHEIYGIKGGAEANRISVTNDRVNGEDFYVVRDRAGVEPRAPGCVQESRTKARCPSSDIRSLRIDSGAGNDSVSLHDTSTGEVTWADEVVARLGKGADVFRGGSEADTVRAGPGSDVLRGGPGGDRLFGQQGNDGLDGGRGNDLCDGGPGKNRGVFASCETRRRVTIPVDVLGTSLLP